MGAGASLTEDAKLGTFIQWRDQLGLSKDLDIETAERLRAVINDVAGKSADVQDDAVVRALVTSEAGSTKIDGKNVTSTSDGSTKVDAKNLAAFAFSKTIDHPPPVFRYFDPVSTEKRTLLVREIKLPHANQTHEVVFEPVTKTCLVSQMSNSVLVRIGLDSSGFLLDNQDAWQIGEREETTSDDGPQGISGLHNVSISHAYPGCVWLSLQFANTILLVNARTMTVMRVMRVPTVLKTKRIGGPHCVRECPTTGELWVALKGAVSCHPSPPVSNSSMVMTKAGERPSEIRVARLKAVMRRACCSPHILEQRMQLLDNREDYSCPPPTSFAVWRIHPEKYDKTNVEGAHGGTLYECLPSPPMLTLHPNGDCFVAQDQAPFVMHISASTGVCRQIRVDHPRYGATPIRMTGPGICVGPTGLVWCSVLSHSCTLTSICMSTSASPMTTHHRLGAPDWAHELNLIHFVFDDRTRTMYAISSDLLQEKSPNCLVVLRFDEAMSRVRERRVMPLLTQDCACHRIELIRTRERTSVVISELASSKLIQIDVGYIDHFETLEMRESVVEETDEGNIRYCEYTPAKDTDGHRA